MKKKGKPLKCKLCGHTFRFSAKDRASWTEDKMKCPSCNVEYSVLPKTERILRQIQDKYKDSGRKDLKYIHQIYEILISYSRSLILKKYSNVVIDPESLDYHSHCSSVYLIERYFKNPEFEVNISFAGFLMHKIKESLWKKEEHSAGDSSIDSFYKEESDGKGYYDIPRDCINLDDVDRSEDNKYVVNSIIDKIRTYGVRHSLSRAENFKRLMAQVILFDSFNGKSLKADGDMDQFFKRFPEISDEHFKKSMTEIKEML